jgi:hypothetical protein
MTGALHEDISTFMVVSLTRPQVADGGMATRYGG